MRFFFFGTTSASSRAAAMTGSDRISSRTIARDASALSAGPAADVSSDLACNVVRHVMQSAAHDMRPPPPAKPVAQCSLQGRIEQIPVLIEPGGSHVDLPVHNQGHQHAEQAPPGGIAGKQSPAPHESVAGQGEHRIRESQLPGAISAANAHVFDVAGIQVPVPLEAVDLDQLEVAFLHPADQRCTRGLAEVTLNERYL